jgi:hypothetical protein
MTITWIDILPLWSLFPVAVVVILACIEAGYRIGRLRRQRNPDEKEGAVGAMSAASLGLLAFFLAITFGFAANRFDERRHALIDEVNAIGTCFLRSETLPDRTAIEVQGLLRNYIQNRIEGSSVETVMASLRRAEEMQSKLWPLAMQAVHEDRSAVTALFVASLNEVIDLHTKRVTYALHSRLPGVIWTSLTFITVLSMAVLGYLEGLSRSTRSPAAIAVVLMFATIFMLIADLDRPGEGSLRLGPQMMIDLERQLSTKATAS